MKTKQADQMQRAAPNKDAPAVTLRFILYTALTGAAFSVFQFNEAVASKSLGAGKLWVTFLVMCMPVANMTSLWWGRILIGRDQRRLLAFIGCFVLLCLGSALFLSHVVHLLVFFALCSVAIAVVSPAENRILQQHATAGRTGRLFGKAKGVSMVAAACVSLAAGWYMELVDEGYRHVYAAAGVISIFGFLFLAMIPTWGNETEPAEKLNGSFILLPLAKVWALLKRRPDYFRFEAAFMIYGFAFMMSLPVVPLYLVEDLKFDYATFGMTRAMVPQLVMAAGIPFFGKMFDRSTPHRMSVLSFLVLSMYPLLLIAAGRVEGPFRLPMVYAAFVTLGCGLSSVVIIWSLSSLRFAGAEDAGVYQSVHVAATGVRGLVGPFLGYFVMVTCGKVEALACCCVLWTLAAVMMAAARFWDVRSKKYRPLHAA